MFDINTIPEIIETATKLAIANEASAKRAISVLDLTSLNDDDTIEKIEALCQRAQTPAGNTAAICVYAPFIETSWKTLGKSGIKTATVVNFPKGDKAAQRVADETADAVAAGADEIDLVMPYQAFLAGDHDGSAEVIAATRQACGPFMTLKVILETGEYPDAKAIYDAARLAIYNGANFVKTSTGKVATGATPEAAIAMIAAIRDAKAEQNLDCGFKASGGVRNTQDAALYLAIADHMMGADWATPATFRFGASSVLTDLLKTCGFGDSNTPSGAGNY
ncbi:deoxyribose-phosphate aldolase [Thalassospira marina]|uniref:Deoxyribose-phosphate aldolase n=1 Tax=Thalassospira marina TaxID=2048283 RepID=A0A2N3KUU2_9PROT|nr:deoxyribose-phosphate aldolase [Thalassospira marina]PKR54270.1 deoxyribose-phosphate aldolase [Thalassospira marina]